MPRDYLCCYSGAEKFVSEGQNQSKLHKTGWVSVETHPVLQMLSACLFVRTVVCGVLIYPYHRARSVCIIVHGEFTHPARGAVRCYSL